MIPHWIKVTEITSQQMMLRSVKISIGILLLLLLVAGCHTPLAVKQMQAKNPLAKNAAKTPVEIVDAWNACVQTTPEGTAMRGLAGRVHFYDNQKKHQAIKVDGDFTVYVFDGNETNPAHTKPLKIFRFEADTLEEYYSHQKPLGHGYNFFLPVDEIGGEEKSLCILVRLDDKLNEALVMKPQPTHTILAGRKPLTPAEPTIRDFLESNSLIAEASRNLSTQNSSAIQQVGYTTEITDSVTEKSKTSTIHLNNNMARRLIEAQDTVSVAENAPTSVSTQPAVSQAP